MKKTNKCIFRWNGLSAIFVLIILLLAIIIRGKKGKDAVLYSQLLCDGNESAIPVNMTLITAWKEQWKQNNFYKNTDFISFLEKIYKDTEKKYITNKNKNFIFKSLFIGIMVCFLSGLLIYSIYHIMDEGVSLNVIAENSILCIIVFCALFIVSKWLDIKKYQETWARHRYHKFLLEKEICLYLYKMDKYEISAENTVEIANKTFMKRIFEIEEENIRKFVENMETKEIRLTESLKDLLKD